MSPMQRSLARPHKYGARRVEVDGHSFPSAAEAKRYGELRLLERAGEIADLSLQPKFPLHVNGQLVATYIGDFRYVTLGSDGYPQRIVIEDVKGYRKGQAYQLFRLKAKLFEAVYGFPITEIGKSTPRRAEPRP